MPDKPRRPTYRYYLFAIVAGLLLCTGCPGLLGYWLFTDTVISEERVTSPPSVSEELTDDRLGDKNPPPFDPLLVDQRPWQDLLVNKSAAVIKLDLASIGTEREQDLLTLFPSFLSAAQAAKGRFDRIVLPSVNLVDGKAKQFDDGLYAALELAYYRGLEGKLNSHVALVRQLQKQAGKNHPAAPYLAAALHLAGIEVEVRDTRKKEDLLEQFRSDEVDSKPISFYTWNEDLSRCFRFLRFLQTQEMPPTLTPLLAANPPLKEEYQRVVAFFSRLTNPPHSRGRGGLFPASTSREAVLFEKLFRQRLPSEANLMLALIRAIRSGQVSLEPDEKSGWYDYQVHALETLLLPDKGEEGDKLLLTQAYKKRMLEAFKALIAKHRETHVRQLHVPFGCSGIGTGPRQWAKIKPRLRVEPCPSYYIRTARAYAFLTNFLESSLKEEVLRSLHGLKKDGQRRQDLHAELLFMRQLFYGLYLISAEDIGLKPHFLKEEAIDRERCYRTAEGWLARIWSDPDLAADTRVSVPIFQDKGRGITRLWATLGVRLALLDASYAVAPQLKPRQGGTWQAPSYYSLEPGTAEYLLPVDEFAEVELQGMKSLTRQELRTICDRERTKSAILAALHNQPRLGPKGRALAWVMGGVAVTGAVLTVILLCWRSRKRRTSR
jgi:hypothetical protein